MQVVELLDRAFNKDELSGFYQLGKLLLKEHQELASNIGKTILEKINSKKAVAKYEMLAISALCFFKEEIYQQFLKLLKPDVRKVWELMVFTPFLDQHSIEKEAGVQIGRTEEFQYYKNGPKIIKNVLSSDFKLFKLDNSSRSYSFYNSEPIVLYLPQELRKALVGYYRKDHQLLRPMANAPAAEYIYDTSEQVFQQEYIRLKTYFKQGLLAMTGKNRPALPSLNKMQRALGVKEFFPNTEDKKLGILRSYLLGHLLPSFEGAFNRHQQLEQMLKSFFQKDYLKTRTMPATMPHLKGMGYIEDHFLNVQEENIWLLLQSLPSNGWVSMGEVFDFYKYNAIDFTPVKEWLAMDKLYYEGSFAQNNSYNSDKRYIKKAYYRQAISTPYIMGNLFLLAALGICDIAYNRPGTDGLGEKYFSYWDGLQAIRRTALGDYICGHTKTWQAPNIQASNAIRLSADTLIIYTDEPEMAKTLLEPYAVKAGTNTFKTDSQLFLKNTRSKKELESKIILFKQLVQTALPANWEAFFSELMQKISPFESPGEVYVFKIPENNQTLIKLLAQDSVLKQLMLKAEGYHIIVPKSKYPAFNNRLKEFGYLLV
ncbi:MAG TPA: hypothetical protein PKA00_15725 [Saprospiraceae bacterium]|nr:hypothetical protein [Saprospiraceae bacterium]HMQ84363.1 hypothetical protein [Saprospiraceae bacterium]